MPFTKKILMPAMLLAYCMSSQSAFAVSAYNSDASITYNITATNLNTPGNLDDLDAYDDGPYFIDDVVSATSQTSSDDTIEGFSDFGVSYTQFFQAEDSIASGVASSEYIWEYSILFESFSSSDIFKITLDFEYDMNANVSGESADTEAFFDYSTLSGNVSSGSDTLNAFISGSIINPSLSTSGSKTINFFLNAGETEEFYFDFGLKGTLEATETSPVPVPAALWLFASALLAFPGLRKLKVIG